MEFHLNVEMRMTLYIFIISILKPMVCVLGWMVSLNFLSFFSCHTFLLVIMTIGTLITYTYTCYIIFHNFFSFFSFPDVESFYLNRHRSAHNILWLTFLSAFATKNGSKTFRTSWKNRMMIIWETKPRHGNIFYWQPPPLAVHLLL